MEIPVPVFHAAASGNLNKVRTFFNNNPRININTYKNLLFKKSLLLHAATSGRINIVRYLVLRGANVNLRDSQGMTPLTSAVWIGHNEVAEYLIDHGADVNVHVNGLHGATPMICAIRSPWLSDMQREDFARALIQSGRLNLNARDVGGRTAAWWAAREMKFNIFNILIEAGARTNNSVRNAVQNAFRFRNRNNNNNNNNNINNRRRTVSRSRRRAAVTARPSRAH
jgi:ankyrin repeat protein